MKQILTIILVFLLYSIFGISNLYACDVPVFLYALARWYPDTYEVTVLHRGELSPEETSVVEWLKKSSEPYSHSSNLTLHITDIKQGVPETIQEFWDTLQSPSLPCFIVRYPMRGTERAGFWYGPLTKTTALSLVDSPARQEIIKRLLKGDAVIWVLLESGNKSDDDTVSSLFHSQLPHLSKTLALPDVFTESLSGDILPSLSFSMIRISRNDSKELNFIDMLMHSESGLTEFVSYPIAFPIFGRGRAFPPLVGKGINERNIRRVCEFAIGECSCEIKSMNPGMDILMSVNWNEGIARMYSSQPEVPPLAGLSTLTEVTGEQKEPPEKKSQTSYPQPLSTHPHNERGQEKKVLLKQQNLMDKQTTLNNTVSQSQPTPHDITRTETPAATSPLFRNIFIGIGLIIIIVGIFSTGLFMQKKGKRS